MPESGRGFDESAKGTWRANRDFNFRNLKVKKGEALPPNWQYHPLVKGYLKKTYGEDCVYWDPRYPKTPPVVPADTEPVGVATVKAKGKK